MAFISSSLWPMANNEIRIKYYLLPPIAEKIKENIYKAVELWKEKIQHLEFEEHATPPIGDYIEIRIDESLGSSGKAQIGCKKSGAQWLKLGPDSDLGTAVHEFGHSLGFYHEHQRPDRLYNVVIDSREIKNSKIDSYLVIKDDDIKICSPYDLYSMSHYDSKESIKNRDEGYVFYSKPRVANPYEWGRNEPSSADVVGLNWMYRKQIYPEVKDRILISPNASYYVDKEKACYFFNGAFVSKVEAGGVQPNNGFPKKIENEFPQLFQNASDFTHDLSAAMYHEKEDNYWFFKGASYAILDSDRNFVGMNTLISKWPFLDIDGFKNDLSAVVFSRENELVYLFAKSKYIKMDINSSEMPNGYPMKMEDKFKNWNSFFNDGIDSVMSYHNKKLYFFKQSFYARYEHGKGIDDIQYTPDSWPM